MSRSYVLRIADMIECCERVLRYTDGLSMSQLLSDSRTFDAVLRNLEIIGEAAKHVPDDIRIKYPDIDWRRIAGLRDVLSHGYFGLDNETLWGVIAGKVPSLLVALRALWVAEGNEGQP